MICKAFHDLPLPASLSEAYFSFNFHLHCSLYAPPAIFFQCIDPTTLSEASEKHNILSILTIHLRSPHMWL